jgi:hypothetical protein
LKRSMPRQWQDDFPIRDEVEDFAGTKRSFLISCFEGPLGYTVRAREEGVEHPGGYEFAAYSETTPYDALGRVRDKMQRDLATRHLSTSSGGRQMLHRELRGRITSDGSGVVLVVDGIPLDANELASLLSTFEGWAFELRIEDALR